MLKRLTLVAAAVAIFASAGFAGQIPVKEIQNQLDDLTKTQEERAKAVDEANKRPNEK